MPTIGELLRLAYDNHASDLFLCAGKKPSWRLSSEVVPCSEETVKREDITDFRRANLGKDQEYAYSQSGSADAACMVNGRRFRLNFFETINGSSVAARPLRCGDDLFLKDLKLPESFYSIADASRGLILVCGATGSGKSTTLSALVNYINRKYKKHILTLEDPIEFIHSDFLSIVSQREINSNASSFAGALRSALRENPDVIVIGEMRDLETVQVALNAAMTGHLVICTVHTSDTLQAVERIINLFPEERREQTAIDLSLALDAIVAQRLLPAADGNGMIPAVECLLGSPSVRKHVGERDYRSLEDDLKRGSESGMITFTRSIFRLYQNGSVSLDAAGNAVGNRDEFDLLVKGMESGVDAFRNHYGALEGEEMENLVDMRRLLRTAVKAGASDMHLSSGASPTLRIDGVLREMQLPALSPGDIQRLLFSIITPRQQIELEQNRELDLALSVSLTSESDVTQKSTHRFRVNGFYQRGNLGVVARVVPQNIPTPEQLTLPPAVMKFITKQQGLVLVTGPTGSGKSTTLACLIDQINQHRPAHIITIEDPIEYVHVNKRSLIEQRELHADTLSFATALKYALRQDPDVILVGEMRDVETMAAAITAAETGHLVFATIHTNSAPQTIDRIIDSFPSAHQNQIRQQLASVLLGVVSQRLLPKLNSEGRVAAFEVMVGTPPVQALIREGKTFQLQSVLETAFKDGMITLDRSLQDLYERNLVSIDEIKSYQRDYKMVRAF